MVHYTLLHEKDCFKADFIKRLVLKLPKTDIIFKEFPYGYKPRELKELSSSNLPILLNATNELVANDIRLIFHLLVRDNPEVFDIDLYNDIQIKLFSDSLDLMEELFRKILPYFFQKKNLENISYPKDLSQCSLIKYKYLTVPRLKKLFNYDFGSYSQVKITELRSRYNELRVQVVNNHPCLIELIEVSDLIVT
jgi:hypothetical protein